MQRAAPRTQGAPLRARLALTLHFAADIRIYCLRISGFAFA